MKRFFLLPACAAILILGLCGNGQAEQKGSADIVLNGGKTGNVPFPHQKHQLKLSEKCNICHDIFPQEKLIIDQMKKDGRMEKKKVMNHCLNCHKQTAAKSEPAGPVKCKECHSL